MRKAAVLLSFLLIPACGSEEKYHYSRTPNGMLLSWQNIGSVPDWYSVDEVGLRLEGAVDDAVAYLARYGASEDLVRSVAASHKYIGFDMPRFAISASGTGYASGAYFFGHNTIMLAFWSRAKGNVVPSTAPPWTVYSWPTRPDPAYDWGYEPPAFSALAHEIGHGIWGPNFEHGWTPPLAAGYSILSSSKDWTDECVYADEG